MTNTLSSSVCVLCDVKLIKNGRNTAGNQRWKCPACGASTVRKRADRSRHFTLQRFLAWLQGKHSQAELDGTYTGRTFRHHTAWCWDLNPRIPTTGVIHDVVQLDGFNLRTGWCVLVAISRGHVIGYQWCSHESEPAWSTLLERFPAPRVVVCDGGPGIHAALRTHWGSSDIQRCLVHLQRNVRKYVTTRSRTVAGKALWGLARKLTRVHTPEEADAWGQLLLAWEAEFLHLTKQRTYRKHAAEIPAWVRPTQQWWYTHQRLRSAHQVFRRVIKAGHLFTFLDPTHEGFGVPATTNEIEGAINSPMRLLLLHHRGMSEEHQRRAIEWWLYLHSEYPDPARVLAEHHPTPAHKPRPVFTDPDPGPELYGTGLDASEGLWERSGWAGRG